MAEGAILPVTGFKNDGDDAGRSGGVALEGALHFEVVAVVRIDKPSRDQQQNDFGGFELLLDCGIPLGPGFDVAVLPGANFALAL